MKNYFIQKHLVQYTETPSTKHKHRVMRTSESVFRYLLQRIINKIRKKHIKIEKDHERRRAYLIVDSDSNI